MVDLLGGLPGIKGEGGNGGQGWLMSSRPNRSISSGNQCSPPMKEDSDSAMAVLRPKPGIANARLATCTDYCYPRVYLDGVEVSQQEIPNINRFTPDQLEAIEVYSGAAQVPPEYNRLNKAHCGVVLLHSRRGKSP
jgi:hypothetical protein